MFYGPFVPYPKASSHVVTCKERHCVECEEYDRAYTLHVQTLQRCGECSNVGILATFKDGYRCLDCWRAVTDSWRGMAIAKNRCDDCGNDFGIGNASCPFCKRKEETDNVFSDLPFLVVDLGNGIETVTVAEFDAVANPVSIFETQEAIRMQCFENGFGYQLPESRPFKSKCQQAMEAQR
jgi:DNA-directed RNA polymerase subunit RPC12/RpoP